MILPGKPCRLMTIASHCSAISDLVFSADDSFIHTCASDGTVYSYTVMANPHSEHVCPSGSYFSKGSSALSIAVGASKLLIVCYNSSESHISGCHLAVWSSGDVTHSPTLIHIDKPVTHISVGRIHSMSADNSASDVCAMGCADGCILVTSLPFPVMLKSARNADTQTVGSSVSHVSVEGLGSVRGDDIFSSRSGSVSDGRQLRQGSGSVSTTATHEDCPLSPFDSLSYLDIAQCKEFSMHSGPVSRVIMAPDGNRIFSTGHDGAIFKLAVTAPSRAVLSVGVEENQASASLVSVDAAREYLSESDLMLTSRREFENLHSQAAQLELTMQERVRESETVLTKLTAQVKVRMTALEAKLKWEVSKRDDVILSEREDHEQQVQKLRGELSFFEKQQKDAILRVEAEYEKKIAQDAIYLERLRQVGHHLHCVPCTMPCYRSILCPCFYIILNHLISCCFTLHHSYTLVGI